MDSGFAAGLFTAGGQFHQGVHEPLISAELWQAYQDARGVRRARPARVERSQYLLSGLVVCGRCGGSMVAGQFGANREPKYRCKRGKENGPEACTGGYVMARFVEAEVLRWLEELAEEVETARAAALAAGARRTTVRSEADRLAREVTRVEEELGRLALANARAPMPEAVYDAVVGELTGQLQGLREAHEEALVAARRAVVDPGPVAADLVGSWETWPVEHRREVLRSLTSGVVVHPGRPRAVVRVVPVWGP
jgi:site-specific DNA recombinase